VCGALLAGTERADLACARRPAQPSPAPARRREPRCLPRPRPCRRRAREREPESPPPERSRAHAEPDRHRHGHHGDLHPFHRRVPAIRGYWQVRASARAGCPQTPGSRDPIAARLARTAAPRAPGSFQLRAQAHSPVQPRPPCLGFWAPLLHRSAYGPAGCHSLAGTGTQGHGRGAAGAAAGVPRAPGRRDAFGGGEVREERHPGAAARPRVPEGSVMASGGRLRCGHAVLTPTREAGGSGSGPAPRLLLAWPHLLWGSSVGAASALGPLGNLGSRGFSPQILLETRTWRGWTRSESQDQAVEWGWG
jgi:hypothetical protein